MQLPHNNIPFPGISFHNRPRFLSIMRFAQICNLFFCNFDDELYPFCNLSDLHTNKTPAQNGRGLGRIQGYYLRRMRRRTSTDVPASASMPSSTTAVTGAVSPVAGSAPALPPVEEDPPPVPG